MCFCFFRPLGRLARPHRLPPAVALYSLRLALAVARPVHTRRRHTIECRARTKLVMSPARESLESLVGYISPAYPLVCWGNVVVAKHPPSPLSRPRLGWTGNVDRSAARKPRVDPLLVGNADCSITVASAPRAPTTAPHIKRRGLRDVRSLKCRQGSRGSWHCPCPYPSLAVRKSPR